MQSTQTTQPNDISITLSVYNDGAKPCFRDEGDEPCIMKASLVEEWCTPLHPIECVGHRRSAALLKCQTTSSVNTMKGRDCELNTTFFLPKLEGTQRISDYS